MTSIARLPQSSRTFLRSTTILTSIPQIIHELVQNSLDANASQIDISLNMDLWQCWVRDNGHGIDKTDMRVLARGGEEGRYGSSKAHDEASLSSISTLGFRGEALASAADVSILEIASRTATALDTWSIILKGGKALYYGVATRWKREYAGTTVVVRDAFYNLPVRRRTHPNVAQTVESIRRDLECMAMVFPHVAFSLENAAKEQNEGFGKGRILTIPKTSSSLATFRHLFGKSICESFEEINSQEGSICVQGFLGIEGVHTKLYQYIYLNRQLLSFCDLHKIIDARLSSSSFGRNASETDASVSTKRVLRRSPRKNERRLVYLLSITLPSHMVDNCLEPAKASVNVKDSDVLCKLLDRIIRSFLVRNGFVSSSQKHALDDSTDSPTKKPRTRRVIETPAEESLSLYPHCSQGVNSTPFARPEEARWADEYEGIETDGYAHIDISRLGWTPGSSATDGKLPEWIQNTLAAWKNPTFGLREDHIRSVSTVSSQDDQPCSSLRTRRSHNLSLNDKEFVETISTNFTRAQLENAEVIGQVDTKFIACLVENGSTPVNRTLVLVDQHAADERVRVERFLSEICRGFLQQNSSAGIKTVQLDLPIPVLLNRSEAKVYRKNVPSQVFARWGFNLEAAGEIGPSQDEDFDYENEYFQVLVKGIPELLSEKLLTGDELREFVKSYLARLAVEGVTSKLPSLNNTSHWTSALRLCPRELIDLVNSKACRGAIMFNDDLNLDQCQRLIFHLSRTVWPFMCAHGRPSLIPLTSVELENAMKNKPINWSRLEFLRS